MAGNPPISRVEFTATSAICVADPLKFTFPLMGNPTALTVPFADLAPMKQSLRELSAQITDLAATLKTVLSTLPPPPPPPVPVDPMSFWVQPLSPNCIIKLAAGTQQGHLHIPAEKGPVTFVGAGMRQTILDGQRGVGAGHRLSFGKGIIHVSTTFTARGIGFVNGGGGDNTSDGETSVYAEDFTGPGTVSLEYCAFDGNEDGIFSPAGGSRALVTYLINYGVFGRLVPNGDPDGLSHDTYICAHKFEVRNSIFCGTSAGNTIKSRSPNVLVEDSFVGRRHGRWIDLPGATDLVTSRNTFVTFPDCTSRNAFGLNDEGDDAVNPGQFGSWISTDDTFYFSRWEEAIWLKDPRIVPVFIRPVVFWIGAPGATPPNVVFPDNAFASPFVFTEANRVSAAPDVPPDPVFTP